MNCSRFFSITLTGVFVLSGVTTHSDSSTTSSSANKTSAVASIHNPKSNYNVEFKIVELSQVTDQTDPTKVKLKDGDTFSFQIKISGSILTAHVLIVDIEPTTGTVSQLWPQVGEKADVNIIPVDGKWHALTDSGVPLVVAAGAPYGKTIYQALVTQDFEDLNDALSSPRPRGPVSMVGKLYKDTTFGAHSNEENALNSQNWATKNAEITVSPKSQ